MKCILIKIKYLVRSRNRPRLIEQFFRHSFNTGIKKYFNAFPPFRQNTSLILTLKYLRYNYLLNEFFMALNIPSVVQVPGTRIRLMVYSGSIVSLFVESEKANL